MDRGSVNSVSLDSVELENTPVRGSHLDDTLDSIAFDDWTLTSLSVSEPMTIDPSSSYRTGPDNGSNCHSRDLAEDGMTTSNLKQDFFNLPWLMNSGLSYNTLFWGTEYTNNIYRGAYPLPLSMNLGNTHPELASSHNAEPLQNQHRSSMQPNETSIPTHFMGHNWWPFQAASFEIPPLSADDENVIHADLLGHVGHIPEDAYQKLAEFYAGRARSPFMDKLAFQTFLDLFCEHFSGQLSFIHPTLLEDKDMSQVLLLAVGAVGAQYSALKQASLVAGMLQDLLIDAVKMFCPGTPSATGLTWTQTILLRDICLQYNGGKRFHFERQYDKNRLITFARALRTDPQEPLLLVRQILLTSPVKDDWKLWIADESRVRLLHSIYYLECLQPVFHDIQPLLELVDLTSDTPCPDHLWKCSSETEWKHALANCRQQGLLSDRAPQVDLVNPHRPEGYVRKLSFVYLYTEERLAIKRLMIPTFRNVLFPTTLLTFNGKKQQNVDPKEAIASMRDHVASELNVLYPMNEQDLSPLLAPRNQEIIFTLLRLLRYIPMGNLLAFSGWQASDSQVEPPS
ncbi:hypothetical protein FOYG_08980 [Fusarium oxysporum NRRL 32931]|uniref:Transcription factor domain-containing protein n=1 Tax=Fusarium oxysporum NRRL 32931 TaxID=660029 RepID=W9IFK1_FUSOX|nr:hypothetical protein FOYG_08980 [Fusarium oxysporum NRRL 32931]